MIPDLYNTPWLITRTGMDMLLSIAGRSDIAPSILDAYQSGKSHEEPVAIETALGEPLRDRGQAYVRDGVAVIPVMGPIVRHADMFSSISGATSLSTLGLDLGGAISRADVRSILLNIDSPGGEVNGIAEMGRMIRSADGRKPVTTYSGGTIASAAFWLGTSAGEVVISETTQAGSIGVVAEWMSRKEMEEKLGIKRGHVVSDGSPNKWLDPETPEGQAQAKSAVNEIMGHFTAAVARNRGVDVATVLKDFGQGGILIGKKAVKAGMADRVGTFQGTFNDMKRGRPRPKPADSGTSLSGGVAMSIKSRLIRAFSGASDAEAKEALDKLMATDPAPVVVRAEPVHPAVPVTVTPAQAEELDKLRAENSKLREDGFKAAAESFADRTIHAGKASPAERESIIDAYRMAASDDHVRPAGDGQKTRVQLMEAQHQARPKSLLTEELMDAAPPAGSRVISPSDPGKGLASSKASKEFDEGSEDAKAFAAMRNGRKPVASN